MIHLKYVFYCLIEHNKIGNKMLIWVVGSPFHALYTVDSICIASSCVCLLVVVHAVLTHKSEVDDSIFAFLSANSYLLDD